MPSLSSTIELAHNMGLKVVAEGVDHAETLQLLQTWGCDFAQGYYISRPLPTDTLEAWLNAQPLALKPPLHLLPAAMA